MASVSGELANLVNGVSQQAVDQRLASQAAASTNFYPTLVDGLTPRPPTEHLASLGIAVPANALVHIILRDADEKYVVVIQDDGTVRVWDFDGAEKTVTDDSTGYLGALTNPKDELVALTADDYTFIVNKSFEVAAAVATADARPYEALIGVLAGQYGKTYRINIDGAQASYYTAPSGGDASHAPWIDTVQIAGQLYTGLSTGSSALAVPDDDANAPSAQGGLGGYATSPWALGRYHSTLYIRNTDTDFTLSAEDGYAGKAMKEAKGRVQRFSDLPLYGPSGVVMEVAGDENTAFDNYWVKFEKLDDEDGSGVWTETVKPAARLGLDADTMPHTLVRNEDGTFTFGPATWTERVCGDEERVPDPSFVGETINDVFWHKNRLGFLAGENYTLSEAGAPFNFFRSTLLTLLDTDPIDGAASHVKITNLRHAVPYAEELLLFSDSTQFRLSGNELLTPKTVNARPLSELSAEPGLRPIVVGSAVYFAAEGANWASVYEYYYDAQVKQADDTNTTGHVPALIPAGVHTMAAQPSLDLLAVATSGDPDALYVYAYHFRGQEKVQSAWQPWSFPGVERIVAAAFDKKKLVIVCVRGDGDTHIEVLNCEPGVYDTGLTYRTNLDRRVALDDGSYNSATDETTFVIPYDAPEGLKAVTGAGGETTPAGVEIAIASATVSTVVLAGDLSEDTLYFGTEYEARHRVSTIFYRKQDGTALAHGRTQIIHFTLNYDKSAYFSVEVTPVSRPTRTYPFASNVVGEADTGAINIASGRLAFPVLSRNDRVTIDIVADTWRPCAFTKASWKGTWAPDLLER